MKIDDEHRHFLFSSPFWRRRRRKKETNKNHILSKRFIFFCIFSVWVELSSSDLNGRFVFALLSWIDKYRKFWDWNSRGVWGGIESPCASGWVRYRRFFNSPWDENWTVWGKKEGETYISEDETHTTSEKKRKKKYSWKNCGFSVVFFLSFFP